MLTKEFDGELYRHNGTFRIREKAMEMTKKMRDKGNKARLVKTMDGCYLTFVRGVK